MGSQNPVMMPEPMWQDDVRFQCGSPYCTQVKMPSTLTAESHLHLQKGGARGTSPCWYVDFIKTMRLDELPKE